MSTWGMVTIGLIYAYCAYDQFKLGNMGMGFAFLCWAGGQMGIAYSVVRS